MAEIGIQNNFNLALEYHRSGRLREAAELYRKILAENPRHADALHYLGLIAHQAGRYDVAVDLIRQSVTVNPKDAAAYVNLGNALQHRGQIDEAIAAFRHAIALNPNEATGYNNVGNVLREKGQFDEAIAAYRQAIALRPNYAEAYFNLGNVLQQKGEIQEAIAAYRQAIVIMPNVAEAHGNLGNALRDNDQLDEAIAAFRQAIAINPNLHGAYRNLAIVLKDKGQLDEAIAAYRQSIALNPNDPAVYTNLGNLLKEKGHLDQAIACYQSAMALKPGDAETHFNLGNAWNDKGQLNQAIACFWRSLELRPDWPEAYGNLGNALRDNGQLDQAITAYRETIRLNPGLAAAYSNLINTIHFHPDYDAKEIHAEHLRWQQQHAEPLKRFIQPHNNDRDPDRRLRIGYVSADFYQHVLARAVLPLLQHHDRDNFQIFCYANVLRHDETTKSLREAADQWRDIAHVGDEAAAELIRRDGIDILVDLDLHTARNRLLLFARKPAPVQVAYLGYCGGTGLEAMDYRLSDRFIDPLDTDLSVYSEQTIRLPDCYWCYNPHEGCPDVSPLPAAISGIVTFGSMNKFGKVTPACLDLWARVLAMIPRSRMLIHAKPSNGLDAIRQRFGQRGIEPDRLEFVGSQPLNDYLRTITRIDIGLDTFPCSGGITTCDFLWMGVPVVSLAGGTSVGRAGSSILNNVGLPELLATAQEQYFQLALNLAGDVNRLRDLRLKLRPMMQRSPLLNGPQHTRHIEAAYRQMWRTYCERNGE
jgi:protein O-GlcNAc transferase